MKKLFDISTYSTELCNKFMNQDNASKPEQNPDELYKTAVYLKLIEKLKSWQNLERNQ